jgi:hypothetical protein
LPRAQALFGSSSQPAHFRLACSRPVFQAFRAGHSKPARGPRQPGRLGGGKAAVSTHGQYTPRLRGRCGDCVEFWQGAVFFQGAEGERALSRGAREKLAERPAGALGLGGMRG